jgi:hypothetical protein
MLLADWPLAARLDRVRISETDRNIFELDAITMKNKAAVKVMPAQGIDDRVIVELPRGSRRCGTSEAIWAKILRAKA